jgi:hypothetical protein
MPARWAVTPTKADPDCTICRCRYIHSVGTSTPPLTFIHSSTTVPSNRLMPSGRTTTARVVNEAVAAGRRPTSVRGLAPVGGEGGALARQHELVDAVAQGPEIVVAQRHARPTRQVPDGGHPSGGTPGDGRAAQRRPVRSRAMIVFMISDVPP